MLRNPHCASRPQRGVIQHNHQLKCIAISHQRGRASIYIRPGPIHDGKARLGVQSRRTLGDACEVSAASDVGDGAVNESRRVQLSDVVDICINLPWQKIASWAVVVLLASLLKDFLGVSSTKTNWNRCFLIASLTATLFTPKGNNPTRAEFFSVYCSVQITMGTFIVLFIGNGFVDSMAAVPQLHALSPQRRRRLLVLVYFTFIVMLFTLFGVLIIPDVVREGADFVSRLQTENLWVVVLEKMRSGLGDNIMDQLERFLVIASTGDVTQALDFAALDALSAEARTAYLGSALQKVLRQYTNAAASLTTDILSFTSRFAIQVSFFPHF